MIVVWKNTNHPDFVGEEVEFFKVTWTGTQWLRDVNGKWWGVEHPTKDRNIRLMGEVEDYGEPVEASVDVSIPEVVLGRPELKEVDEEE